MKNSALYKIFFSFFMFCQFGFAQVDVVYSDLVWSDEFNTNGGVNPTNWFHQTQIPASGSWFNGEVQHYTDQLTNSFVNAGTLNIVAKKEPYTDQGITKQYTSARLNSKFAFKYGRVDIRAKIPKNLGTWPALWMLGKNINEDGAFFDSSFGTTSWPACGEIDIIEHGITQSQPDNYIQSALHTPSSFGNTINIGGVVVGNNIADNYHIYSVNWSPFQISFLLDGVVFYTYNPDVKTPNNWPFNEEQYLLLNIAMGGGTVPSNFTQSSMLIDYVRVYQNTLVDSQAPTNFTASIGAITSTSVELLLNATDNSGTIGYNVAYGSSSNGMSGASGIQKSVIISGLTPNTYYNFTVTANDLSGNPAANNPIVIGATTLPNSTLICSGTSTLAQQGSFTSGYNYEFQTNGTDVKITYGLLDTDKVGVVAYLWKQSPFSEAPMTNVSGNIFTRTITGQTIGATINYGVKFAFAGGLSVTNYYSYVVGSACSMGVATFSELNQISFSNPVTDFIDITSNVILDKVEIYNPLGNLVLKSETNTNTIDVTNLSSGIYLITFYSGNERVVKKVIIQ